MRFQTPLQPARLIRRYKRFLSDMELPDGRVVTAHCPNPGSMLGMADPGAACWIDTNDDPRKKLRHSWKLVEQPGGALAVVDTSLANRVVSEALHAGAVPALAGYDTIRPEVRFGAKSRIDFLLQGAGRPDALVEVKSVTLSRGGWAEFPDSVTARGARHLADLAEAAAQGYRAVLLFLIARDDQARVRVAADIDPAYARAFDAARDAGVQVVALTTRIDTGLGAGPDTGPDTGGVTAGPPATVCPAPQWGGPSGLSPQV